MSESIDVLTRQAAEPDRKFPLTDMPNGLMAAALVTRLLIAS
jgi:hypothetical protein